MSESVRADVTSALRRTFAPPADVPESVARSLIEAIDAVLHGRKEAVYVSTPITTGPEFVRWWRANPSRVRSDRASYERELTAVIESNIAAVRPVVHRVEGRFQAPVIDPTRLDSVPGWHQPDYHRFWIEVIDRFVTTIVFADGWTYSSGCALEYAAAVRGGLPTLDSVLEPIAPSRARELLEESEKELEDSGLDGSPQRAALAALDGVAHAGAAPAR
jgi:hypothetical protein